jgi:nicotinate-nucleotide adenylyltransferase
LGGYLPPPGARIGLLGGSFNPAHEGHRQISLEALKRLGLDEVWWLVSPQNPLKPVAGMAPLETRLARARALARQRRIRVTGIEELLANHYTANTLRALTRRFPRVRFVWLMGADNLVQLTKWKDWPEIFHIVAVAVFDRPSYSLRAVAARAARRFARYRLDENRARGLAGQAPTAWVFIHSRLNALSATQLRARRRQAEPPGSR